MNDKMEPDAYVLDATSPCGTRVRTGPLDVGQALILIDQHLAPNGWAPKLRRLAPVAEAVRVFTAAQHRQPVLEADLFVALRRAIVCDQNNDGADCPRAQTLIAHLEAHRPIQMWFGDEECRLGECDHERADDGSCVGLTPAGLICMACSAFYDSGSEWGPEWLDACRVEWPCLPIRAAATYYRVPLSGQEANADG